MFNMDLHLKMSCILLHFIEMERFIIFLNFPLPYFSLPSEKKSFLKAYYMCISSSFKLAHLIIFQYLWRGKIVVGTTALKHIDLVAKVS